MLGHDAEAYVELRHADHSLVLPDGKKLSRSEELLMFGSADRPLEHIEVRDVRVQQNGDRATAAFECRMEGRFQNGVQLLNYSVAIDFESRTGRWLAVETRFVAPRPKSPTGRKRGVMHWLRTMIAKRRRSFQAIAYVPYMSGQDFFFPRSTSRRQGSDPLPIPPRELRLGYEAYDSNGGLHVEAMLRVAKDAGLEWQEGDRILDFGCGAGRMIRHLEPLAGKCEIWGVDIRSEHILWCKQNLSPPFNFATTTRVPHLPFEDRSFRFIYCGSVFTHIDDLADAWLLELHRILVPGGMLYATIHDENTVAMMEDVARNEAGWLSWVRSRPAYKAARGSFDMIAIGRDSDSQIFYDRDYFCRMLRPGYDVLSIHPEAYFYQTAVLAQRPVTSRRRAEPAP
jgi:SAM-dependent methyltransferase